MALALDGRVLPAIKIIVSCSKGTYIRTLGEDIGAALGCGAHLTFLRRIDTGGLGIERCVTVAQLEAMDEAERLSCLLAPEAPSPFMARCLALNPPHCWAWGTRSRGN